MASWLLQLSAVTFLLAIGIRFVEDRFSPFTRLWISALFGVLWIVAGAFSTRVKTEGASGTHARAEKTIRQMGWMFLAFGIIWIGISAYQYYK